MKKTKNGVEISFDEVDALGSVVDICVIELNKKQPDLKKVKDGLDLVLGALFLMMPNHVIEGETNAP